MFTKNKSKSNSLSELHFVSSLQLKQSVMLVGDIADDHHQVTLTEVSPHEFKFHIDYLPEKSKLAEISGTLQLWNGTETKIDADGTIYRMETVNSTRSPTTPAILLFMFLAFVGLSSIVAGLSGFIMTIIFGGIAFSYFAFFSSGDANPQTVLFRHRDYLLQRLIDAFKSAGEVDSLS